MKQTATLLLLLSVLGLSACGHTPTEPKPSTQQLIGVWNWVLSEGGIYPRHETPSNMGYTQRLTFNADSTASFRRVPDSTGVSFDAKYTTARRYYSITRDTQYFIGYYIPNSEPEAGELLQFHGPDTMLVGDMVADGIQSTYVRTR